MRRIVAPALLVAALLAAIPGVRALSGGGAEFPHEKHAALFPVCEGCHAGIPAGVAETAFPTAERCAACHDGRIEEKVEWLAPRVRASNLRFDHAVHAGELAEAGETAQCLSCHGADGSTEWMRVAGAEPGACLSCHAHEASEHLAAEAVCRTCHVPLAEAARLPAAEIAGFPKPASHQARDFLLGHEVGAGEAQAQCSVCHARQSCERCHPNGDALPAIAALAADDRVAQLAAGKSPVYPLPGSHEARGWLAMHGGDAEADIAECANCHAQPSCRSCHIGTGAQKLIGRLPEPRRGGTEGVRITGLLRAREPGESGPSASTAGPARTAAASATAAAQASGQGGKSRSRAWILHPVDFQTRHGPAAAADGRSCRGCHAERECESCHSGVDERSRFHPANFAVRHAADSYARESDCASCHNTETFCRECHSSAGRTSAGRLDAAYHDAQPLWLLQHGQAARQGLESCTSCHVQKDCMQCHSADSGWGVSPHGQDFDPKRMAERSKLVCVACHARDPTRP